MGTNPYRLRVRRTAIGILYDAYRGTSRKPNFAGNPLTSRSTN